VKHTDITSQNGYSNNAEMNNAERPEDGGGNMLAMLCATFCKDTPLAEAFGANDNQNNNNPSQTQPLMNPIRNGELLMMEPITSRLVFVSSSAALTTSLCAFLVVNLLIHLKFILINIILYSYCHDISMLISIFIFSSF
jgi:hypothetical protein